MRSIGVFAVSVVTAILAIYIVEKGQAQDCSPQVTWTAHYCPEGEGWQCWRDGRRREANCKEYGWGNRTEFPNTRGFGHCFCCGRCRVPESVFY